MPTTTTTTITTTIATSSTTARHARQCPSSMRHGTALLLVAATAAAAAAAATAALPPLSRAILLPEHPIGTRKTDFSELKLDFVPTPSVAPEPPLGAGQVLVRVHASSVNPCDVGLARSLTAPRVPGSDVAGEVVAVGPGCTSPIAKVGTQVFGLLNNPQDPCPTSWPGSASCLAAGAWADYAVASEQMLNTKPTQLSMTEAAVRSARSSLSLPPLPCLMHVSCGCHVCGGRHFRWSG